MWFKDSFHIVNPNRKRAGAVRRFFKKNPALEFMWVERQSHPTHLETMVQWAVEGGRKKIAVWGGDGTISRVVNALYNLNALDKMAVALIPVGTCNDLARKLEIPYWKKWIQKAIESDGSERSLDVGLLTTPGLCKAFVNNAGFGRTASAYKGRSNPIKDILSFIPKKLDLEWELDGARHFETRPALLGVVCNAPYFNGGMHFEKDVEPADGILNAFFEPPQSRLALFLKFLKSRLGAGLSSGDTFRINVQSLFVESEEDLFPQVDGEPAVTSSVRSVSFSILPGRLRLFHLEN